MTKLTADLPGVAVYLNDLISSGTDATKQLQNHQRLIERLNDKGLRCNEVKCQFAQPSVECLGYQLTPEDVARGHKVNDVIDMPELENVSQVKSFLESVNFYSRHLPADLATISETLTNLTRSHTKWCWGPTEKEAFTKFKQLPANDDIMVVSMLLHRWSEGSEGPIHNASETLTTELRESTAKYRQKL